MRALVIAAVLWIAACNLVLAHSGTPFLVPTAPDSVLGHPHGVSAGHVPQQITDVKRRLTSVNDVRGVDALVFHEFSMLECSSGEFSDSSAAAALGALRVIAGPATADGTCPPSTGVRIPSYTTTMTWPLQWENSNDVLAASISSSQQYSVAAWLRLDPAMPITASAVEFYSLSRGLDWEDQIRGAIAKNSATSASLLVSPGLCHAETCPMMSHTFPLADLPYHVAVVVDGLTHTARLYVDAVQVAEQTLSADYSVAFASDHAGLMGVPSAFPGTLYSFAVYGKALSHEEVHANFESGITDSLALAVNATLPYPEDGCSSSSCGSLHPDSFLAPFDTQYLQPVQCPFYDYDLAELQLPTSGLCVLTALPDPAEAEVFDLAGRLIDATPHLINGSYNASFLVRPAHNMHSNIVAIGFRMFDTVAGVDSAEAVLQLAIYPVNDPPVAIPQSLIVFQGSELPITLEGTDVDGDAISYAVIDALPEVGELYTIEQKDGDDVMTEVQPGVRLAANQSVVYRYSASPPSEWTSVTVAHEQFLFHLIDEFDARSSSQVVDIEVQTALRVIRPDAQYPTTALQAVAPAVDVTVTETDDASNQLDAIMTLYGADMRTGAACITSPELVFYSMPDQGALWATDAQGRRILQISVGSSIPMAKNTSVDVDICVFKVNLHYVPPAFFFNNPTKTWDGRAILPSFQPIITAALRDAAQPAILSPATDIQLTVTNVVSPVTVHAPNKTFNVLPFGDRSRNDRTEIQGLTITDLDNGISPIVVEVSTSHAGKVSLNPLQVSGVQFNSQKLCRISMHDGRWKCRGSGDSDSSMRFVGSVAAVAQAVNGMIYRSTSTLTKESIQIKAYRGVYSAGNPGSSWCLDANAVTGLDGVSIYNACYMSEAEVEVTVSDYSWDTSYAATEQIFTNISYGLMIAVTVLIVSQLCRFCFKALHCTQARLKPKHRTGPNDTETKEADERHDEESIRATDYASSDDFDPRVLVGGSTGSRDSTWRMYRAEDGGIYFINLHTGEKTCQVYPMLES